MQNVPGCVAVLWQQKALFVILWRPQNPVKEREWITKTNIKTITTETLLTYILTARKTKTKCSCIALITSLQIWKFPANDNYTCAVKVGFHYPSSRAELTARELGGAFFDTRQLGPSTRVVETGRPCTRAVYTGVRVPVNSARELG